MKHIPITFSILLIGLLILNLGCYQYPELDDLSYSEYRRIIGPEGGIINFYQNYENDSIKNLLVKMEFPENAIDSFTVFNMYQFYDLNLENDLYNLSLIQQTPFLYFVPFSESYGYNEQNSTSPDYHLSLIYNAPVTVSYFIAPNFINTSSKLYRIKIPAKDEWADDNIWVKWNYQGYPDGYDDTDLSFIINGKWTSDYPRGTGPLSLDNWEEVLIFTYDSTAGSITFKTDKTDYLYVVGEYFGKNNF